MRRNQLHMNEVLPPGGLLQIQSMERSEISTDKIVPRGVTAKSPEVLSPEATHCVSMASGHFADLRVPDFSLVRFEILNPDPGHRNSRFTR